MRTGSLSKAAELLCVSQPAVSKVLAHAERSAGLKLFARAHGHDGNATQRLKPLELSETRHGR